MVLAGRSMPVSYRSAFPVLISRERILIPGPVLIVPPETNLNRIRDRKEARDPRTERALGERRLGLLPSITMKVSRISLAGADTGSGRTRLMRHLPCAMIRSRPEHSENYHKAPVPPEGNRLAWEGGIVSRKKRDSAEP